MKHRGFVKRKMLIDGFQYRFIAAHALGFILIVGVFCGALFIPLMAQLGTEGDYNNETRAAARQFMALHSLVWPPIFLTLLLLLLHSVLASHRIAGPLYRLRREIEAIGDGDMSRNIQVRRRDYLGRETAALNKMSKALRKKISAIDEGCRTAESALGRMERAANDSERASFDAALAEVRSNLGLANDTLRKFQFERDGQPAQEAVQPEKELEPVA